MISYVTPFNSTVARPVCGVSVLQLSPSLFTADEDKSIMTEQLEALPLIKRPTASVPVADRAVKRGPGRGRGRSGSADTKVIRREAGSHLLKDDIKKKKGSCLVLC